MLRAQKVNKSSTMKEDESAWLVHLLFSLFSHPKSEASFLVCQNGTLLVQDAIYLCIETGFRKQFLLIKNSPSEEDAAGPVVIQLKGQFFRYT